MANINRRKILALYVFPIILIVVFAAGGSTASAAINKTVYIDPSFGGNENGPQISTNIYAKDITLAYANQLREWLKTKNIETEISRETDTTVFQEKRLMGAIRDKKYEPGRRKVLFISLTISDGKGKDCVRVLYPDKARMLYQLSKRKYSNPQGKAIGNTVAKTKINDAAKGGNAFAKLAVTALKKGSLSICSEDLPGNEFILNHTEIPTVILDFAVADLTSPNAFILNEALVSKIINILANSTEEYLLTIAAK